MANVGSLYIDITTRLAKFDQDMNKVKSSLGGIQKDVGRVSSAFTGLGSAIQAVVAGGAFAAIVKQATQAALAVEKMQAQFNAAFGGGLSSAREMSYVAELSQKLGLSLEQTSSAYAKFAAASRGTSLEGEKVRKVFESVATASTALKLTTEEQQGVFLALGQMMSKGKVQAEELRGQLGERLPGAFKLAADALGMTTAELDEHLQKGDVLAGDLLPKLADELNKTYGGAALEAAKSASAQMARFNNTLFETRAALGSAIMPTMISLMDNVFKPLISLTQQFIGGLEISAVKLAALADKAAAIAPVILKKGLGGVFFGESSEKLSSTLANINVNQNETIDEIIKKYTPGSSTIPNDILKQQRDLADKRLKEEMAAAAAAENRKKAEKAAKEAAAIQKHWNDQIYTLSKRVRDANPDIDEYTKHIQDLNAEESKLLAEKGASKYAARIKEVFASLRLFEGRKKWNDDRQWQTEQIDKYSKKVAELIRNERQLEEFGLRRKISKSENDLAFFKVDETTAIKDQLAAYQELLTILEKRSEGMDSLKDTSGWIALQQEIDNTRAKVTGLQKDFESKAGKGIEGLQEGIRSYVRAIPTQFETMRDASQAFLQDMEKSFANLFDNVLHGKIKSFWDFFEQMGNSFLSILSEIMAKMTIASLMGKSGGWGDAISSLVGGVAAFAGAGAGGGSADVQGWHSGGKIGWPRYHSGIKLASDEVPAILQTGETVYSRKQTKMLEKLQNEGTGGKVTHVHNWNIQAVDASSFQRLLMDNKNAVAGAMASLFGDNHPIRRQR